MSELRITAKHEKTTIAVGPTRKVREVRVDIRGGGEKDKGTSMSASGAV